MTGSIRPRLGDMTSSALDGVVGSSRPTVALVPVGSVEPPGPHLPLATDTVISQAASRRAAERLRAEGIIALLSPAIPYGVTRFASGFAGAISVPGEVLTAFLRAVVVGHLDTGFTHVCLVNNHLEPAHDTAVRGSIKGLPVGSASVACPLTRRWARTLSDEFKSGACHAGEYETSLVLASAPEVVDLPAAAMLPDVDVSLSDGIKAGKTSFLEMGLDRAYTGAPARASVEEGERLLELLATMIATEVREGLAAKANG